MDPFQDLENIQPAAHPQQQRQTAPAIQQIQLSYDNPTTFSTPLTKPTEQQATGLTRFIKLKYYQQYFKVSQMDVLERGKIMLIPPFTDTFVDKIRPTPDFYGPFWVMATVIFLLGIAGNLSNYLHYQLSDAVSSDYYPFKLELIRYAIVLITSLGIGLPVCLYFTMKFLNCPTLQFPQLFCMYGYSLICYIPALILCILPFGWLIWIVLLYAFGNSTTVMILSLKKWTKDAESKQVILFAMVGIANLILFLVAKLLFFHFDDIPEGVQQPLQ